MQKKLLTEFNIIYDKSLQKVGIEGTFGNIINAIYDKPTANIILNGEKQHFSKMRNKVRICPLLPLLFNMAGSPSHGNQRRKRNKRNQNWKRRKTVPFADDMIL